MEYNDSRHHHDEHKDETYKYDYEKMGKSMNYPQMPMSSAPMQGCAMQNCPMYGTAYCPMFQSQPYTSMTPGYMRDDEDDFDARPYRPRPYYPRPYYPRPYYPGPYYPRPFPFFFPFYW